NLVKQLIIEGAKVMSFSTSTTHPVQKIIHIRGDLRDDQAVVKILKLQPEVIISLVGLSGQVASDNDPDKYFSVNVIAHIKLLNNIVKILPKAKFIWSSSRLEYGKPQYLPVDEKHLTAPLSQYGIQKNIISNYCQFLHLRHRLDTVVLRTSNPYGPHPKTTQGKYNVINYWIDQALGNKNLTLYGSGSQKRDYLYIDDLIEVIIKLIKYKKTTGQIYNIGSGKAISIRQMAQEIIRQSKKGRLVFIPWPIKFKQVETGDYISDITRISKDVGWQPKTSIKDGIRNIISTQENL
ncbi:MAG: hypothetical protein ACD_26C00135G0001, partial [uncultured bacterium]